MTVLVYKITCDVTGKSYIGITSRKLHLRWYHHVHDAMVQKKNTHFARAIRKYGKDSFSRVVLYEAVDDLEAAYVERGLIAAHGTFSPRGYNLTVGGEIVVGAKQHPESNAKRSLKMKGRKHTDEMRQHLSVMAKRRAPPSEETREKWRKFASNRKHTDVAKEKCRQVHLGKPKSEEMKRKLSEAKKGIPRSAESVEKQRATLLEKYAKNPRTHCKRGHPFTPENTYVYPDGTGKECKTCMYGRRPRVQPPRKPLDVFLSGEK